MVNNVFQQNKGVQFIRPEIAKRLAQWKVIRDCMNGEDAVKAKTIEYLPYPSTLACEDEVSVDKDSKYQNYIKRAHFLNVVGKTIMELQGQVFIKQPLINIADNKILQYVLENATGNGLDLKECSKQSLVYSLAYGYSGLLVDFPNVKNAITKKDYDEGKYRLTIKPISPFMIKNFKLEDTGAEEKLTLVVLCDNWYDSSDDGFEIKIKPQYRVLRLVDGFYEQAIYQPKSETDFFNGSLTYQDYRLVSIHKPVDIKGNRLTYIPFMFIGAHNNNPYPDNPIMYDLAMLNLSHYRNSADHEQTMFIAGQATLLLSGYKDSKVSDLNPTQPKTIRLGSEYAILLENGGTGSLLQAKSDSGLYQNMEKKEKQMISFGAKFLEEHKTVKTAYQVKVENQAQGSLLMSCAYNISSAYTKALKIIHEVCGFSTNEDIKFELNTDFQYNRVGSDEINTAIGAYTNGAISFNELREVMRRAGLAVDNNEQVLAEYQKRIVSMNKTTQQKGEQNEI